MKKAGTIIGIVAGIVAALAAVAGVLYILDKKGILKLKRTKVEFTEEFPEEAEIEEVEEVPSEEIPVEN